MTKQVKLTLTQREFEYVLQSMREHMAAMAELDSDNDSLMLKEAKLCYGEAKDMWAKLCKVKR